MPVTLHVIYVCNYEHIFMYMYVHVCICLYMTMSCQYWLCVFITTCLHPCHHTFVVLGHGTAHAGPSVIKNNFHILARNGYLAAVSQTCYTPMTNTNPEVVQV